MWCHLWLSNIRPCLLHGHDLAASVDQMKPLITREVHELPSTGTCSSYFITEYWTWDPLSVLSRIISPSTSSRQLLCSHPPQPAFCGLVSTRTDLTQQVPLSSAKTHLNHSKTAQNSKSIYITTFQMRNTRKGKLLTATGTILLLIRISIQHPLIFLRFFTAELAIVSTVSMGLWEAAAAHFHHHPTHTKYVTCYLTTLAAHKHHLCRALWRSLLPGNAAGAEHRPGSVQDPS